MSATTTTVRRGMFTLVIGSIAFLIGLYALVTAGNIPLFTIGTCLLIAGFIGRVMNSDVIDVFILGIVGIAVLVFCLYQVDTHFLSHHESGHAPERAAEKAAEH